MTEHKNETPARRRLPVAAIVGRPNVGKSSLFNVLIGRRLSIVHEMPGVTRDRVMAPVVKSGRAFELIDTGGLGMFEGESRNVDQWDQRIEAQVEVAVADADLLVLVANVQEGVVALDQEVVRRLRASGKPMLFVVNKCDNSSLEEDSCTFMELGFDQVYPVSCQHKRGIDSLVDAMLKQLPDTAAEEENAEEAPPTQIAVIGRPNVGKSSLINALLGEERVMTSEIAGTTRDAIDIDFSIRTPDGMRPAVLVDTAGLRKRAKVDTVVEYFSVMRAETAMARADLVLFVVEASPDGMTAQDRRIASMIRQAGKACVVVANKFDLHKDGHKVKALEAELRYSLPGMDYAPVVFVSARDRSNLSGLLDQVAEVMGQLEVKIPTGILNRVLTDTVESHTPPVVGSSPLKLYYASMAGMRPPKVVMFVNNPKLCADNYVTFLRNTLRRAFDLTGLPLEIELRARPKKVESIRSREETKRPAPPRKKSTGKPQKKR